MQKLTKAGSIESSDWQIVEQSDELNLDALASGNSLIHIEHFLANAGTLAGHDNIGVWLGADDNAAALSEYAKQLPIIAVRFPTFTDGRGFSHARMLRSHVGYKGELLAMGGFMQDQLFYLKRCGFDSFLVSDDANVDSMRLSLEDFHCAYQASADDARPIYRKRIAVK